MVKNAAFETVPGDAARDEGNGPRLVINAKALAGLGLRATVSGSGNVIISGFEPQANEWVTVVMDALRDADFASGDIDDIISAAVTVQMWRMVKGAGTVRY